MAIQLTTDLSENLLALLPSEPGLVDGMEVGHWFSPALIQEYRQQYPAYQFYWHAGNLVARLKWAKSKEKYVQAYLQSTQSPWLSFHCSLLPLVHVWLAGRVGWYLPFSKVAKAVDEFVEAVAGLKSHGLPLLLENMASFATRKYEFESSAKIFGEIITTTDCAILLDIGHARVAASVFDLEIHRYLESLPLERVRQIHVSGPRTRQGHLYDAHQEMQEEDYQLLRWVLERTNPTVVTLEYTREKDRLHDQLLRLRGMI